MRFSLGCSVVLFYLLGANDRFSHRQTSDEKVYGQINLIWRADRGALYAIAVQAVKRWPQRSQRPDWKTASDTRAYDSSNPHWLSIFRLYHLIVISTQRIRIIGAQRTSVRTTQVVIQEQMTNQQVKPKVLVADDERVIADALAIILNQSGLKPPPSTTAKRP